MKRKEYTESILDMVIEGVSIAVVSEFVTRSGKLLQTLRSDGGEIPFEFSVLRQNGCASGHETVDQFLLTHDYVHVKIENQKSKGVEINRKEMRRMQMREMWRNDVV